MRRIKEPFCGISHAAGALAAIAGMIVLLCFHRSQPERWIGFTIYGFSLIFLYTASTLYHSLRVGERACEWLQRLDHSAIFLLIAGTYTPVCLIMLRGAWGWSLLGVVYGIAVTGIILTLCWKNLPNWLRVVLYVCMGWLAMVAFGPLRHALGTAGMCWLIAGGVIYSIGTIIYATDRPHLFNGKFSAHDLWHIFVLGGSACHYFVVLRFVAMA
jgi:hemolysin III